MIEPPPARRKNRRRRAINREIKAPSHAVKLGELPATAICGNDISSSCLYVSALAIAYAGRIRYLRKPCLIPWEALQTQFGADCGQLRDFKRTDCPCRASNPASPIW